jgi:hypothetical protein
MCASVMKRKLWLKHKNVENAQGRIIIIQQDENSLYINCEKMHKFAVRVLQQSTVYEGRRGFMIKKVILVYLFVGIR